MIAAQFPNATAVAPFDVWSDRFGRRIRAGEKGIGLIDDSGNYPKMKYVFDISQSDRFKDVPQPYVWDLQEEYKNDIILSLAGDLSITIEEAVSDFCENTVDSLLADYENAVIAESAQNNILTELDEHRIKSDFRHALLESVKYVALTRCGLDTNYVNENIFGNMSAFSDVQITDILGTAVSNISEQVLREIENTVKTIERRNQNEHNIEESGNNQRNTAFAERGGYEILPDSYKGQADRFDTYARSANIHISSRPDGNDRREGHGDLGTQENEVPEREENNAVSSTVRQPQADRSSDRDKRNSQQSDGQPDGRNDEKRGRDGETQSGKSDGVDTQNELDSEQSRRNRDEKSDTSIEKKPKPKRKQQAKKTEDTQSPVFFHTTHGEQMGLFPAEKTEKDRINEYAMSQLIKHGTGFEDGKFRVQEYFSQQHTKKEKAEFLSHEYGFGGYGSGIDSAEYRPNKGITMNHTDNMNPQNNMTVHLSYAEVAEMIDYLLAEDLYIAPQDIENRQRKAINTIKNGDSNNPFGAYEIEKAKAILDSYNIDYSQLLKNQPVVEEVTAEDIAEMNAAIPDDAEIPDINNPAVILEPTENLHTESSIITEFRRRTDESFHTINGLTASDIEIEVREQLEWAMQENEIAGKIRDVVLYGSRSRGIEDSEKADIDILVEVDGADMKEYALFNFFDELFLEVDGIPVDVNPIRPEQTGTLEDYLPTAEEYLEQKQAEKQEQVGLKVPNDREKLIEEAKKRINDFVSTEYDTDGADFSNLSNINVAYTTTEDGEHEIQASIDLENTSVVRKVDDSIVSITKYDTLEGFVEYLNNLDFSDLTYISDRQLKRFYEQENNSDEEDIKITSAAVMSEPSEVPEEQESVDSYLIIDKTVSIEKYGYTVDFNTISEICFMEENDVYIGGLDGDGHERKDNYAVQQTEISFYLSDGYLMRHESENGDFPVTNEQAAEEMANLIQKALNDRDMLIRIIDTEGNISFLDRSVFTIPKKEMLPDSVSVSLGYSESPIVDDISERIQKSTEPLSFAAINAAFEYLDEKQHLERLNPHLKAGWYKKTDFEVTGVIHGKTFSYAGRFDIGDGKGTGGGSLIDHISDFVDYSLSPTNPLHLDTEKLDRQQKAKNILIPFLKEHTELTQAEQRFLNILKSDYPTGMTEEKLYSLVGKTVDYNDRQYVVDRIDIQNNTAHIRDDNTGWYPLFQDVELRDIVGQNIDLILDEKEQFFRDCDLPSLLAKSSLAWDEIESLGYIFFEKGHIDKYPPTVMAHYGNGSFAEPQVYELARQYQNGEDISKELTEKLFTANGRIPLTHIPFKDSYVEDLDLHIRPTNTGYFVNYGAYSREVTFEEMAKSYLQYFKSEYDNIQKDVTEEENRETAKNMNFDFDTEIDKFYFHEDGVERIHYVPDDTGGGQFKTSQITYDDIIRANQDTKYDSNLVDKTMYFFEKFNDYATHSVIGIENEDFIKYVEHFSQPHDLENAVSRTMFELVSKAEQQTELHSITPRDDFDADADKFFFTENGVEEIYFNSNSSEGGQFVICQISNELILEADKNCSDKNDFFSYLESGAYQILIDITNEEFNDYVDYFNRPANFEGGTEETMSALIARANRELRTPLSPEHSAGTFKIYQLKDSEKNHYKRFEGLDRQPEPVSITDYNLVYEGKLADIDGEDKLESIYTKFNVDRPENFRGHSLSVSDVVVTEQNGQKQAHFVDSVGFQNIPEFFKERTPETEEVKLKSIVIDLRPKDVIEAERQEIENISEQAENYSITDLSLGQRRLPEKFADNLAAIQTLKKIENENRSATPDEQEILSKYTGWGGLSKVFEPDNKHYPEVKELLTDDEFAAARKSTMTAFYTPPVIIKEMYAKLAEMGFNGGKLLEPSCGIGNFIGMIPGNNTQVTGIELDSLTGRIAQQLYPKAQIQVCGFENSKLKENSFDVAVGNVPFGDIRIFDKQYNQNNLLIHDYFFSKSLDMVKPGGVVAFITSKGTLDKLDSTARKIIAEKGDFLGAVRLPNNAFKANAGTEVTSDIIFLKKRENPITITPENEPLWLSTAKDENGIEMNAYFVENPQQICGMMEMVTGQFGMESTCQPNKEIKLSEQIRTAMSNIQGKIETTGKPLTRCSSTINPGRSWKTITG